MEYLLTQLNYDQSDIVIVGRSMGSGPACYLASNYNQILGLVLVSPFTSLKAAT